MSLARALLVVALSAALAAAAPASAPADDPPNSLDTTTSSSIDEPRYRGAPSEPSRPGAPAGAGRLFNGVVPPLLQLVLTQLAFATNLVGRLAGAAGARPGGYPGDALRLFASTIAALSGGAPAPPGHASAN